MASARRMDHLAQFWEDIIPRRRKPWSVKPRRWHAFRTLLCNQGLHWPVTWDESAHPMRWDSPEPPEPDWCCQWCGTIRDPYQMRWWNLKYRVICFFRRETP